MSLVVRSEVLELGKFVRRGGFFPVFWEDDTHAVEDIGAVVEWLAERCSFQADAKSSLSILVNQVSLVCPKFCAQHPGLGNLQVKQELIISQAEELKGIAACAYLREES